MPAMEQNDTGDSVTLGVGSDAGGETDAGKSITLSSFITGMGASMHWSMRGGYMHRDRQKKNNNSAPIRSSVTSKTMPDGKITKECMAGSDCGQEGSNELTVFMLPHPLHFFLYF